MEKTIYAMFENAVAKFTNKTAIIENDRTLTFGQLSELVDLIAGSFPEKITSIGIVMSHCAEMIAAILAVLKCGARYIPAEPNFPTGRIQYMMKEANVDFILTEKVFDNKLKGFDTNIFDCSICGLETPTVKTVNKAKENSPAYVLYTSGTTGKPKGVCVTNGNVCHYVEAFTNEFCPTEKDIMLQYSVSVSYTHLRAHET